MSEYLKLHKNFYFYNFKWQTITKLQSLPNISLKNFFWFLVNKLILFKKYIVGSKSN